VRPFASDLRTDLSGALGTIVEYARYVGLTANTEYSVDFDTPIGYIPVNPPKNMQGVELDAARARIQQLRADRQQRDTGNAVPGRTNPWQTPRTEPRSDSGPEAPGP
jgi:hypothetical protein